MLTPKELFSLFRETFAEWNEDKAPRLGAALAYYAAFSVAPVLIIAIVIAGAVFRDTNAAQDQIVAEIQGLIGAPGAEIIDRMIDQARLPRNAGPVTTTVGVVTLIIGAVVGFSQLQDAFDTIWEVAPKPRGGLIPFLQNRLLSFAMVLIVGFLLLVSLVANTLLSAVGRFLEPRLPHYWLVAATGNFLVPVVFITILFAIIFKVLPDVHLGWRDVWPGAILTGVLFTIGKVVIGFYLGSSPVGTAFGAAGSLLILLVWIYFSAQVLFFGAEFTQVWVRRYKKRHPAPTENAVPLTEAARVQQGMPRAQQVEAEAAALEAEAEPPPAQAPRRARLNWRRPRAMGGYVGTLLAFAAGLGAGVLVALRTVRNGH